MDNTIICEVQPVSLLEHPAVMAWQRFSGEWGAPERVETLKAKKKSAVYRLVGTGPNGAAIIAKRCQAVTGFVERLVYQEILFRLPSSALRCLGFAPTPDGDCCWLFLEDAGGGEYLPECREHRALASRCLGLIERAARAAHAQAWLPEHGPGYYLSRLKAARSSLRQHLHNPLLSDNEAVLLYDMVGQFDLMESRWDELEDFCARQPHTLVHGDFVAKNLRVRNGSGEPVLLAFDWEMAGWGVPATDLVQGLGTCATPDLAAYCAALREDFPQLHRSDVQQIADYGKLLRLVDNILWMTALLVKESRLSLLKPLRAFKSYHEQLAAALRAVAWNAHD